MRRTLSGVVALIAAGLTLGATPALGQLTPDKTYYGIRRAIPMTVAVPAGQDADQAKVALLQPVTGSVVESAAVAPGRIDLAALFPALWGRQQPALLYAQLMVGDDRIGPAVVLAPMLNPPLATLVEQTSQIRWRPMGVTYSGLRAYVDQDVLFTTTHGDIRVRMRPDQAPNTCRQIMELVRGGFYEDIIFHRIVPFAGASRDPFVIQVGDPTGTGTGGPGGYFDLEQSQLPHDFGVMSMARSTDPNSNGSQFFLCLSRNGTRFLDGQYTAFGETIAGAEVIRAIAAVPIDSREQPIGDPPRIVRAALVDAAPYGTGPEPVSKAPPPPPER